MKGLFLFLCVLSFGLKLHATEVESETALAVADEAKMDVGAEDGVEDFYKSNSVKQRRPSSDEEQKFDLVISEPATPQVPKAAPAKKKTSKSQKIKRKKSTQKE